MKRLGLGFVVVVLAVALGGGSVLAVQPMPFPQYWTGQPIWGGPFCTVAPGNLVFDASYTMMNGQVNCEKTPWNSCDPTRVENTVIDFSQTTGHMGRYVGSQPFAPIPGYSFCQDSFAPFPLFHSYSTVELSMQAATGKMTMHWNRTTRSPETMTLIGRQGNGTRINFVVANGKIGANRQ